MYGYGPSGYDHFPANIGPIMSTDEVDPALVTENGACFPLAVKPISKIFCLREISETGGDRHVATR